MENRIFRAAIIIAILFSVPARAQSTWEQIYTILNTSSCNSPSCHASGGSGPPSFHVNLPADSLYAQLYNGTPINFAANSEGNKLVFPGHPEKSFLMRKLSHCASGPLAIILNQHGPSMPDVNPPTPLPEHDLELIFTWILAGAPDTGTITVDTFAGSICDWEPVGIKTLPAEIIAFTAYPNPTTENFSCSYVLERPSQVTMELLDVTGRSVKTLFSETRGAGKHEHVIEPGASSGIYFIRLQVNDAAQHIIKVAIH